MDLKTDIKNKMNSEMAKVNHIEKSKHIDSLKKMLPEKEQEVDEMTGAASAGGYVGPLFVSPIKKGEVIKKVKSKNNKKDYEVSEEKGFSPYLEDEDNPRGETEGLTPDVLRRILKKVIEKNQDEELNEATLSDSSGSYETPFFLAKNKKNWRGMAKTLYKGGKFVKVKDKCKKFPYCNQGDIKALELFEGYNELADKVAKKMGEDPIKVKSIVLNDLEESLFRTRMKEVTKKKVEDSQKNNDNIEKS